MCVLACACIYLYYKESMFMKGNIFKLQMDPLPPPSCPRPSPCDGAMFLMPIRVVLLHFSVFEQRKLKAKPG